MKVKYFISNCSGEEICWAKSSTPGEQVDLIELLLTSDLSTLERCEEFCERVFKRGEMWWFNATKIERKESELIVIPAFPIDAKLIIRTEALQNIVNDWRRFLVSKKEMEKDYSIA